VQVAGLEPASD